MEIVSPSLTIIVSDKFSGLSKIDNKNVICYSNFLENLHNHNITEPTLVYIGQGINTLKVNTIKKIISTKNISNIQLISNPNPKAEKHSVHKAEDKNVAITEPRWLENLTYEAELLLDDECAEMSDHVTGIHVQGILLIESGRQMMMASMKKELDRRNIDVSYAYVLKSIHIDYFQYLYPVHSRLVCTLKTLTFSEKGLMDTNIDVDFYQSNKLVCTVNCHAQGFVKRKLTILENRMARTCLAAERDILSSHYDQAFDENGQFNITPYFANSIEQFKFTKEESQV